MRQNSSARSSDVLRHTDSCTVHLRFAALTSQLLDNFHKLIYTRRADWMSAGF
jgi:hypothetical protein